MSPLSARILLVDSDGEEAARVRACLVAAGATVTLERRLEGCWERLSKDGDGGFDAVVLEDRWRETGTLKDVKRILRRLETSGELGSFLVLIGEPPERPERVVSAVLAGAYTYLMRPLKEKELVGALTKGLRNRKKLLGIVSMAGELSDANRELTAQKHALQAEKAALAEKTLHLNLMNEISCDLGSSLEPARIVSGVAARLTRALRLRSWALLFAPVGVEKATLFTQGPVEGGDRLAREMLERLTRLGCKATSAGISPLSGRPAPPALAYEQGLTLPLIAGGNCLGTMKLLPGAEIAPDGIRLAEGAANMLALGLRNAAELIRAQSMAFHDGLTRLANRRAFERQLRAEWSRARRYRHPLSLLMADIDHFKDVNDRFGHQVGDRVLRQAAQTIRSAVRDCDFVARYGGEEFAVILPQTGLENSLRLAERIKEAVQRKPLIGRPGPVRLTMSLGVSDSTAPEADDPLDLVRLADHALYLSKAGGRDRVTTWRDLGEAVLARVEPSQHLRGPLCMS